KEEVERLRWMRVQLLADPLLGDLTRLVTAALRTGYAERVRVETDVVVPEVEAALDPRLAAQHERRNSRSRGVPLRLQQLGERRDLRVEVVPEVVADAVLRRQCAREDAGVRDERERAMRVRPLVENGV